MHICYQPLFSVFPTTFHTLNICHVGIYTDIFCSTDLRVDPTMTTNWKPMTWVGGKLNNPGDDFNDNVRLTELSNINPLHSIQSLLCCFCKEKHEWSEGIVHFNKRWVPIIIARLATDINSSPWHRAKISTAVLSQMLASWLNWIVVESEGSRCSHWQLTFPFITFHQLC